MSHILFIFAPFSPELNSTGSLILTTNRSSANSITEFITMCLWLQENNFPPICRGGFRGGDLVTCHPLFSDMTLQSQILVIEPLFLTSVSKFIWKYLLSRQFSYMYSSCSNPLLPLSNLATIDKRKFYYRCLIPVHCCEITLDFFEKVSVA